jgi:integrase/recombinase XerD
MQLSETLELLLRDKTLNTKRAYGYVWKSWSNHCPNPKSPTLDDCSSFLLTLRSLGASDATVRHRYQVLRSIYDFLVSLGLCPISPWVALGRIFSWRSLHRVRPTKLIPKTAINGGLNDYSGAIKEGIRDRAFIALLFGTGVRISEAWGLCVGDVLTTPNGVPYLELLRTKAGKVQQQPIPEWTWEYVSRLVSQRKSEFATASDALWCHYRKSGATGRLSISTLCRIYRRKFGTGPHSARATFATQLKDMGFADEDVAVALRHATTQQVKVYDKRRYELDRNVTVRIRY